MSLYRSPYVIHKQSFHFLFQLFNPIMTKTPITEYMEYFWAAGTNFEITELSQIQIAFLAGCWILVFFALCAGVRSFGKVVYVTSILPLLLLIVFLARALTLPGAFQGQRFLFFPNYSSLRKLSLWTTAASEVRNLTTQQMSILKTRRKNDMAY